MIKIGKYSMGLGDRFGHQGAAQLKAIIEAGKHGIEITPVWNKSNREHSIIGTVPEDVRKEADAVTKEAGFNKQYFVDADHINLDNVDKFLQASDFFTIDVAAYIGKKAEDAELAEFIKFASGHVGKLVVEGIPEPFEITREYLGNVADKYLYATRMAGVIYRKIEAVKGKGNFVTEVSMDEVPDPQKPAELYFILMMLGKEGIPAQTIAPKFTGRFNKGVDYVGDISAFATEFEYDLLVIAKAVREFGLPDNLKISVHSGSDKFAIYPVINRILSKHGAGLHLKTAGTTWLEEVIGLAESGGEALQFAKEVYIKSLNKIDELCAPYADVIDIDRKALPGESEVMNWSGSKFASSLRHITGNPDYNPNMRQLIHVAYKMAAIRMDEYFRLLERNREVVSGCVYENVYDRHVRRLFSI
ncbi:MAG: tagaturonate epimerase family protein [Bacteroidales bacterium]